MKTIPCLIQAIRRTEKNIAIITDTLRLMKETGIVHLREDNLERLLSDLQRRSIKVESDLLEVSAEFGVHV